MVIFTYSLKHQLYRLLILLSIPGTAVIIFTLLLERHHSIEQSEKKVENIAKQLILQQKHLVDDIDRLARYLAKEESKKENIATSCPNYFNQFRAIYAHVANIGIIDPNGIVMCTTSGLTKTISIADRAYFQNALKSNQLSVGYFQHDRNLQKNTLNFALPIINKKNVIQGVVVIVVALDWWNNAFNNIELPTGSIAAIADSNGKILARYPPTTAALGDNIAKTLLATDSSIDNEALTKIKSIEGEDRMLHHSIIYKDPSNNSLNIHIALPITHALKQINNNFFIAIGVFILSLLVLCLIARKLLKTSIIDPINNLTNATNVLAKGEMPSQKTQPNNPELNTLYQRFKSMAQTRLTAEANLKNKHDELTSLLNTLPDSYVRINIHGDILNITGQFKPQVNPNSTAVPHLSSILSHSNVQLLLSQLSKLDVSSNLEFTLEKSDPKRSFEARISAMQSKNEYVVVLRDITQRKINEEALHLASLVYNNSSEGMAITDPAGIIFDVNPAFCKTTLYSKEEVIGRSSSILSSGKHDKNFYNKMWSELQQTGRWQGEVINRKKNGQLYSEWLTIDTVYDTNNAPIRRIAIFTDLTEKKQADETIWRQAHYDHLTDLPNRLELKERLNQRFSNIVTPDNQLVVMLLDIDHFKDINDTLGHHYGDNLLKLVSQRIVQSAKNAEFVARIGGDEFVIVFNRIKSTRHINQIASNILLSLSSALHLENEELFISASMGIACAPNDGENTEQLLKAADQAMYKAKSNGRNCFEFFSADMREYAHARMVLLKDLRSAIELEQFELFYQPIVALNDLHIHKAEALIRWQHPEKGLISPVAFIPLAEETRQINAIGQFVFAQTLQTLNDIKTLTDDTFQISVNVSPVQLSTPESGIDEWYDMLKAAKLPASSIVAEITEGLMINPEALTQRRLKEIVKSGMQLALDDFGTGYSSLAYLQEMDTDYLKIDKRFVDNIQVGSQELALCEAIIVMAHQLGLKVIAEGIETELQMQLLLEAGCDYGQGYLFSRPLNKSSFMALLADKKVALLK
ncbi:EAL domain-containing protein [Pseudoalteromonas sp. SG45-1]|uniref:bifunctional diguanylate cyclase/phosphodiesterase n=1 Tax=Pseudoalteromonas sp. SG45-1 TaxID=2760957 RepID=UPI0015FFEDB7|nr:EAL domain-containing protein [Pseudoalteromonas sp. SG45-1]MBB1400858.1 EAL domain-containing protein [Pseudoalteromonas sp. SG45-1]